MTTCYEQFLNVFRRFSIHIRDIIHFMKPNFFITALFFVIRGLVFATSDKNGITDSSPSALYISLI